MATPKLDFVETVVLLIRVLGAGQDDPDVSAQSATPKTMLGLSDLKKPPPLPYLPCGRANEGCEALQGHPQLPRGHLC